VPYNFLAGIPENEEVTFWKTLSEVNLQGQRRPLHFIEQIDSLCAHFANAHHLLELIIAELDKPELDRRSDFDAYYDKIEEAQTLMEADFSEERSFTESESWTAEGERAKEKDRDARYWRLRRESTMNAFLPIYEQQTPGFSWPTAGEFAAICYGLSRKLITDANEHGSVEGFCKQTLVQEHNDLDHYGYCLELSLLEFATEHFREKIRQSPSTPISLLPTQVPIFADGRPYINVKDLKLSGLSMFFQDILTETVFANVPINTEKSILTNKEAILATCATILQYLDHATEEHLAAALCCIQGTRERIETTRQQETNTFFDLVIGRNDSAIDVYLRFLEKRLRGSDLERELSPQDWELIQKAINHGHRYACIEGQEKFISQTPEDPINSFTRYEKDGRLDPSLVIPTSIISRNAKQH